MMMRVAEIQVAQVNGQREKRAQNPDRIMPVKPEVNQQQERTDSAAFPKAHRDDTPARSLGGDPLNDEARAEDDVARPAENFPAVHGQAEGAQVR